jgi:hypothetical protein
MRREFMTTAWPCSFSLERKTEAKKTRCPIAALLVADLQLFTEEGNSVKKKDVQVFTRCTEWKARFARALPQTPIASRNS